ncbi:MAG: hypothetical protein KC636_09125 [Myxococcales bacterium]|nr:hypothetical protein [Myxococcales bacterium]
MAHGLEHAHPRDAEDVGGDAGELDVGLLEDIQEAVALGSPRLDELSPVAQQIAQPADGLGRHEAGADETVPNEVGDPLAVLDVRLAPRDVLDVVCVADDDLEVALEDGVYRLPVHARALHGDVGDAEFGQPVAKFEQVPRERRKPTDLLTGFAVCRPQEHTDDEFCAVHVDAAAPFHDCFHERCSPP